jgi:lipopolysaccharide biosynthesis glycosyltransferase
MTAPQRHDTAVALCCDQKFFPFALFMIWQIAHHNPLRRFDFVISSQDDLVVPDWAKQHGIVLHKTGAVPEGLDMSRYGSLATLFRFMLARELGNRYRRILYMDCDMFVEGGDFSRLLNLDLGPHPIGAVLDVPHLYVADYKSKEFTATGLAAKPYFNSGLQLIDTKAYVEQEVEQRAYAMIRKYPQAIFYSDQSMLNLALHGRFAQLAPCWNWQANGRLQLLSLRYPVFAHHFIGPKKPDRESSGQNGARFNQAYRDFFGHFMPEMLAKIAAPCDPAPMTLKEVVGIGVRHVMATKLAADLIARFPDPYQARL